MSGGDRRQRPAPRSGGNDVCACASGTSPAAAELRQIDAEARVDPAEPLGEQAADMERIAARRAGADGDLGDRAVGPVEAQPEAPGAEACAARRAPSSAARWSSAAVMPSAEISGSAKGSAHMRLRAVDERRARLGDEPERLIEAQQHGAAAGLRLDGGSSRAGGRPLRTA